VALSPRTLRRAGYGGAVAVLNSIPDWFAFFFATMIAAPSNTITAVLNIEKRNIKKGKVIKMVLRVVDRLWWASAFVVGSIVLTSPAESG
jgi:ABC-type uncharacterized transport system permease subunit